MTNHEQSMKEIDASSKIAITAADTVIASSFSNIAFETRPLNELAEEIEKLNDGIFALSLETTWNPVKAMQTIGKIHLYSLAMSGRIRWVKNRTLSQ